MKRIRILLMLLGLLAAGCSHIGPRAVPQDRFDYNKAVSDSWKEQTLLNIVKIRYADMPLFMEISSIVSGYALERSVELGGSLTVAGNGTDGLSLGTSGKFTDRPTITYSPITGATFNKNFMTPIPPSAVLFLTHSGWPADIVLPLTVEAINGLRAQKPSGTARRTGDSDYYRVIQLLSRVQRSGALGVRVIRKKEKGESLIVVIRRSGVSEETREAGKQAADLLGIDNSVETYSVAYGEIAQSDTELAILTRSILSIMVLLAGQMDVPREHITEGLTIPSVYDAGGAVPNDNRRLIAIGHSKEKPPEAFVAVTYKNYWFFIDDHDFVSKRTFAYLMILFSLTETAGREGLPLVTIPAG